MQVTGDAIAVEHFRIPYDVEKAVAAIRKNKLPEEFAQMFIRGISLDSLMATER
jgi:hypothetical protein